MIASSMISSMTGRGRNQGTLMNSYSTTIRQMLNYGSIVYSSASNESLKLIDAVLKEY